MHYLPSFIIIFVIGVFALGVNDVLGEKSKKEKEEYMHKVHKNCVEITGVKEETIEQARQGDFDNSNQKFKCYSKCVMREMGAMNRTGGLDVKTFLENIPDDSKETVKKMFEACSHFTDEELCQRAYNYFKCTYEADPEHYFVI